MGKKALKRIISETAEIKKLYPLKKINLFSEGKSAYINKTEGKVVTSCPNSHLLKNSEHLAGKILKFIMMKRKEKSLVKWTSFQIMNELVRYKSRWKNIFNLVIWLRVRFKSMIRNLIWKDFNEKKQRFDSMICRRRIKLLSGPLLKMLNEEQLIRMFEFVSWNIKFLLGRKGVVIIIIEAMSIIKKMKINIKRDRMIVFE